MRKTMPEYRQASVEDQRNSGMHGEMAVKFAAAAIVSYYLLSLTRYYDYFIGAYVNFFLTLLIVWMVTRHSVIATGAARSIRWLAEFLDHRGALRSDPPAEAPKFALIRIAFGLFMIERAVWIGLYLFPADWDNPLLVVLVLVNLAVAGFVTVGFLTQYALAYLVLLQWQVADLVMATSTLGNDIAAMLALLLVFANAGAHYSIDSRLWRTRPALRRWLCYYAGGLPSRNTLQVAKFLALFCYWCVCVYSLMSHLSEEAWMTGAAGPLLLTGNFVSRFHNEFSQFFELGPWAVLLGKFSLWAMLPWYGLLLPLVLLGGLWRTYVLVWAVLFFTLSLVVLQLGWLAQFEFLLFAGLFWQKAFIAGRGALEVAYDDRCNLCDRTVGFIRRVDLFQRVELRPLSRNQDWLAKLGIDPAVAMYDLHAVDTAHDNRIYSGYDFYMTLSRQVLLLLPFYPLLLLGKWAVVGPLIYRSVADRRTRLFGTCEIPSQKYDHSFDQRTKVSKTEPSRADPIVPIGAQVLLLAFVYLVTTPAPFLGWAGVPLPFQLGVSGARAAHIYGMTPIDVFNRKDLALSENWFTLSAVNGSGDEHLLPIMTPAGERLAMHRSDRVYFGHTLPFRRAAIDLEGCLFDSYKPLVDTLTSYFPGPADQYFIYRQYNQPMPDFDRVVAGQFVRQPVSLVCQLQIARGD